MSTALPYLQRIRDYYLALGYPEPYRWASYEQVPFARLRVPLRDARIAIITTAAPYRPDAGEQGPGAPYNGKAKFFEVYSGPTDHEPDIRISHIAIDRDHTTAEDLGSYFPLRALKGLVEEGVIGSVAPRFHGLPTDRSQDKTINTYANELLKRCREDDVDGVLLVPNCPVCHQSVGLVARVLEDAGISTVITGCARDIVESVGVPRLLFNDFPLGNAAGIPNDPDSQREIARLAMQLLEEAGEPRATWQSPFTWPGDPDWKRHYSNAALLSDEEIARRREEFERVKQESRTTR